VIVQYAVFVVAGLLALGGALSMVLSRNAVHSALFLVGVLLSLAILFLLQNAFLVAVLQMIVYAGAIMVLFIFVVMLLGVDKQEALTERLTSQRPLAAGLGLLLAAEAVYLGVAQHIHVTAVTTVVRQAAGESNVTAVGRDLFTSWAFPFEATSVLLIVAVVGVMVLARRKTI
jgi:NADH-quinone oxidoreductase subunit J